MTFAREWLHQKQIVEGRGPVLEHAIRRKGKSE